MTYLSLFKGRPQAVNLLLKLQSRLSSAHKLEKLWLQRGKGPFGLRLFYGSGLRALPRNLATPLTNNGYHRTLATRLGRDLKSRHIPEG